MPWGLPWIPGPRVSLGSQTLLDPGSLSKGFVGFPWWHSLGSRVLGPLWVPLGHPRDFLLILAPGDPLGAPWDFLGFRVLGTPSIDCHALCRATTIRIAVMLASKEGIQQYLCELNQGHPVSEASLVTIGFGAN